MEKEKSNSVGFILLRLKTEQFATFKENYKETISETGLRIDVNYKLDKGLKQIGVFSTFSFDQKKKVFLKIQVSCFFGIKQESWDRYFAEEKIIFPKGFIQHITALTVSSARGILHDKTEGTEFNKFLIPTIDITQVVKENVEFDILR